MLYYDSVFVTTRKLTVKETFILTSLKRNSFPLYYIKAILNDNINVHDEDACCTTK